MRRVLFLLGQLSDRDVAWLSTAGRPRVFEAGEVLIHEGRPVEEIFLLLDGVLAARVGQGDGPARELARLFPGEITGELSFLDSRPPNATVVALEPCRVLAIPRAELKRRLELDDGFAARFYRALGVFLASRLRQTVGRLGLGAGQGQVSIDPDELDTELLDQTALAGARFEHLLSRFRKA